jgi:hypothetical protein
MAIPKSILAAKRWVRNRGRGRPRADELKAAIKLLGGKRKYNQFVKQVKLEKAGLLPSPKKTPKKKVAKKKKKVAMKKKKKK